MPRPATLELEDKSYGLRGLPVLVPGHGTALAVAFVSPKPLTQHSYADFFDIALIAAEKNGRYRLVPGMTRVRHTYEYNAEVDEMERQGSRLEMAFSPTDPTALFAWTWDAPTLYRLRVNAAGVDLVTQRALDFRPVLKANFGMNMYFAKNGSSVNLVSTCPWDHYMIDPDSLRLLQRTPTCPYPDAHVAFVGYSQASLLQLDAAGTVGKLESYAPYLTLQTVAGDSLQVSMDKTQLAIVPFTTSQGRFALSVTVAHNQRRYHGIFRDIWSLVDLGASFLQPWAPPPVQYPRNADGDFDDTPHLHPLGVVPTVTYALSLDVTSPPWVDVTPPFSAVYLRMSTLRIEGVSYILEAARPHIALIRDARTLAIHRVLQYATYEELDWLRTLSLADALDWSSPFLLPKTSLQLAAPVVHKAIVRGILPTDDMVFDAAEFCYADDILCASDLGRLGPHAFAMVLSKGYLAMTDLVTVLNVLPSLRREVLTTIDRAWFRGRYLDFVELTYLYQEPDAVALCEEKAASVLLFLASVRDEEAFELLAASSYFKLRGERKDRVLAVDYLEMLPPRARTLHGKNGEEFTWVPAAMEP
ncbi:hypothetical protein ACHHYP_08169 [Achlya hypogyna]|uniref:Uncharacterized protein n=1 Tax=Achlya hypogyna TaxID=1202772 RepID=A0A1V9YPR2_ACHHY|nr:hypothetical protein ACHHYP_08169 [Achlya hypogyna]